MAPVVLASPNGFEPTFSLAGFGHAAALTVHRAVIHSRAAASLPAA